jgi:hypothetical protein
LRELRVEPEPDIHDVGGRIVGARVAAEIGEDVLALLDEVLGRGQVEGGDAQRGQALQLAGLADAVAVQVAPDLEVGECRILGIDDAVLVLVERAQLVEAAREIARRDLILDLPAIGEPAADQSVIATVTRQLVVGSR